MERYYELIEELSKLSDKELKSMTLSEDSKKVIDIVSAYKNRKTIEDNMDWIDVLVDFWHTHNTGNSLPEFLGISKEDYAKFVEQKADLVITVQNK